MNLRYFILTIALLPSIAYTMELEPKKEDRTLKHQKSLPKQPKNSLKTKEGSSKQLKKHPKKESQAVFLDKPKPSPKKDFLDNLTDNFSSEELTPVATQITSMMQKIAFNGQEKPLYDWFKNHKTNKFGRTPIIEAKRTVLPGTKCNILTFSPMGNISRTQEAERLKNVLALQQAIYISNLEKHESISYGALVLNSHLNFKDKTNSEISIALNYTTNSFLLWFINEQFKKSKKSEDEKKDKKKDKKKEELIDVSAECNEAATKALESLQ